MTKIEKYLKANPKTAEMWRLLITPEPPIVNEDLDEIIQWYEEQEKMWEDMNG